jgi:hypothetical protein
VLCVLLRAYQIKRLCVYSVKRVLKLLSANSGNLCTHKPYTHTQADTAHGTAHRAQKNEGLACSIARLLCCAQQRSD